MLIGELATCKINSPNCDTHHECSFVAWHHSLGLEHLAGDLGHKLGFPFLLERFKSPSFADTMVFFVFDRDAVEFVRNLANDGSLLCKGLVSRQYSMLLSQTYLE